MRTCRSRSIDRGRAHVRSYLDAIEPALGLRNNPRNAYPIGVTGRRVTNLPSLVTHPSGDGGPCPPGEPATARGIARTKRARVRRVTPLTLPFSPLPFPLRARLLPRASRCRTRAGNYSGRGSGSRSGGGTACARTRQNQTNARANSSRSAISATRPTSGGPFLGAPTSANALSIFDAIRQRRARRIAFSSFDRLARNGRRARRGERG